MTGDLKYFSQPEILQEIGRRRLAKFLNAFDADLKASNLVLPNPDTANGNYFSGLAAALALPQRLPETLRKALFTLEEAASPHNDNRVWAALQRRIPSISVSRDRAL